MSIVSHPSSNQLLVDDQHIDALRDGDCSLLPILLERPQAVHRLPAQTRQSLMVALLSVIGDSRSAFTSGVKKESALAMRLITTLVSTPTTIESAAELKLMLRTLGTEELKKLKLERHLLSQKEDVAPAAVEFVKTMTHVLRCSASDFISSQPALAKLDMAIQQLQSGTSGGGGSGRVGTESRRGSEIVAPPAGAPFSGGGASNGNSGVAAAPASGSNTENPSPVAGSGGAAQAHRVRALPSKPSSVPHEQNPLYDPNTECGLMNIHTPSPVLLFAKHFGLGCIPRIPRYNVGGSLVLAAPSRKQSLVQETGSASMASAPEASAVVGAAGTSNSEAQLRRNSSLRSPVEPPAQGDRATPSSPARPPLQSHPSGSHLTTSTSAAQQQQGTPTAADHSTTVLRTPPPAPPHLSSAPNSPEALHAAGTAGASSSSVAPEYRPLPVRAPLESGTAAFELIRRYTATGDGVLIGWGQNRCGEIGVGHLNPVATPRVIALPQTKVLHIACGAQYSLLLTKSGQVLSCGAAEWGQLGIGDPTKLTESSDGIPVLSTLTPIRNFKPNDVLADVCAGYAFAVAVTENGEMYLWGNNNHGQCSLGSQLKPDSVRVIQPTKVGMRATRVISVACGSFFVVILTATGTVLSWGLVSVLGLGPEDDVLRMIDKKWAADSLSREKRSVVLCPCKVSALDGKNIVQVCAGQWHVVAVGADGAVYSWGVGHQGRLGHGVASQETRPRRIDGLKDVRVRQASCGSFHSCVVGDDGRVFVFGDNANGQCGMGGQPFYLSPTLLTLPAPATYVSCGREQTTILLADGDVMACGSTLSTGVGYGSGSRFMAPTRILTNFITLSLHSGINHSFALGIPRSLELIPVGTLHAGPPSKITSMMLKDGLVSAALGASFTVVVNRNGETFAFGNGDWGQLGMGSPAALLERSAVENVPVILHPQRIPELAQVRVAAVAAGYAFALAITESQKVLFWGNNNHSQSGLGPEMRSVPRIDVPTEISALSDKQIVQVACGSFFVLALTASMEVYSWGIADCCGHGKDPIEVPQSVLSTSTSSEARQVVAVPCKIQNLSSVVTIAAGQWHALALTDKGYIYSWGVGHQGRLGTGDTLTRYSPTKISFSVTCASIGCGSFHSWALTTGSDLYMWGDNDSGQCGTDRTDTILFPQHVASEVRSISCGRQHSVLITNDGRARVAGLVVHQDKQYKCKSFDAQPQPPPIQAMQASGKFALHSFSGPHHTFMLVEKDRPAAAAVSEAGAELRFMVKRANLSGNPIPAAKPAN